jgi:DASS family divalent anion:Na+ symporter
MAQTQSGAAPAAVEKADPTLRRRLIGGLVVIGLYFAVQLIPRPVAIKPEGWRLLGIFGATIGGLILQPIAGGALVLIAVTLASVFGGLTIQQTLEGYADPTVWLVMSAFFISIAMIKTGFARRMALIFVRTFGKTALGVSYALSLTDMLLAGMIPSNGARSGGVVLPIARSVAELYGSRPGVTAPLIGSFLMTALYQNICVTAAMFLTGQASNPLAAKIAGDTFHFPITWPLWALAGIVPGLCSLALIPYLIYRLDPPEIRQTPEAAAFAGAELRRMGRMDRGQTTVLVIFFGVCGLWITSPLHHLEITLTALLGCCALLVTGILHWEDLLHERAAWDMFIWYGGLVRLGRALSDAGVTREFAKAVGGLFPGSSWIVLFAVALLIYFYTHYVYASITAHLVSMFTPFVVVLTAKGAPLGLMIFAFACFTNFSAGLTNYGTTPSPMFYATGYVSFRKWWKAGFAASLVNIGIWSTVGFAWWKLIGIW